MEAISYIDRSSGQIKQENVPSAGMLKWLYTGVLGKAALHLLFKRKLVSALGGRYMNTRRSAKRIAPFVAEHGIDMNEYRVNRSEAFSSFNDFFYRKIKPEARPLGEHLVSPADGKILVFPSMTEVNDFFVKGNDFTLESFLRSNELALKYREGAMAIIRLAPPDYHRYHFPADGLASANTKIKGYYYSVSPLALRKSLRIFCENKREYTTLATKQYGDILIADVGATMVGSIIQSYSPNSEVKKGDEKGYFAFGGSTLVLFFENEKISFDNDLIVNTRKGLETTVRMGENIAR